MMRNKSFYSFNLIIMSFFLTFFLFVSACKGNNAGTKDKDTRFAKGLIAYFPFNGNAKDESLNRNNGVIHGAILTKDRFGKKGAYSFDGINDYIILSNSKNFANLKELTISLWFKLSKKTTSSSAIQGLVVKNTTKPKSGDYWIAYCSKNETTGEIQFIHQGGGKVSTTTASWLSSIWYHITITFKSGSPVKIYVNGVLNNTGTKGGIIGDNCDPLYIGANQGDLGGIDYFAGSIDEVAIYNRELSAERIFALYNQRNIFKY